jgi:hypothetical protein
LGTAYNIANHFVSTEIASIPLLVRYISVTLSPTHH